MPELLEIKLTCEYLEQIIDNKILDIQVFTNRYKIDKLNYPLTIQSIDTKGKFLWMIFIDENNNEYYLMNTFGLTGKWCFKELDYVKLIIKLENINLYYCDKLNYGTIVITKDKKILYDKVNKINRDLFKEPYTVDEFIDKIKKIKSKKEIVKILMAQDKSGIGSGIGNYLVCEILYIAKISPYKKTNELSQDDIINLWYAITNVIARFYINNDTEYIKHIGDKIIPKIKNIKTNLMYDNFLVYKKEYDPYGNKIIKSKIINNRTTYHVDI